MTWPATIYDALPRSSVTARRRISGPTGGFSFEYATAATTPAAAWASRLDVRPGLDSADYVIVACRATSEPCERGGPVYAYDWSETHDPQGTLPTEATS